MFAGGERQSVRGWIVFGAVSVFWMPVAFGLLESFGNDRLPFDATKLLATVALFTLSGLPLALPCCLIRWMGHPLAAWIMLVCLGFMSLLLSVVIIASSKRSYLDPVTDSVAAGATAAVFSLLAWIFCGLAYLDRDRKHGFAGAESRGDGGGGSEMRNRSGDLP